MCDLARCKPVDFGKNAIDELVLSKEKKDVIRSLVHAEFTSQQSAGRIILLHGPPGTGKTYVSAPFRMRACVVLI